MTQPSKPVRRVCDRCLRPQRTCICHLATRIDHAVEVMILQHPLEVSNAKGSARLLHLSLQRSRLIVGETFAEEQLRELLFQPSPDARSLRQPVLLYPGTAEDEPMDADATMRTLTDALRIDPCILAPEALRLIVIDGTWRKSRKMLFLNPLLRELPRLALRDTPLSQYRIHGIRRAHAPNQLSTLEATAFALMRLEQQPEKFQPLLTAFNGFVAQLSSYAKG
ncbi:MAG: hypothetical protein JWO24_4148 [Rhodospirillales bacterium]|nr:hypothetical protein [Rhodospirillales bacterium]